LISKKTRARSFPALAVALAIPIVIDAPRSIFVGFASTPSATWLDFEQPEAGINETTKIQRNSDRFICWLLLLVVENNETDEGSFGRKF
jgi:hypothetical protein